MRICSVYYVQIKSKQCCTIVTVLGEAVHSLIAFPRTALEKSITSVCRIGSIRDAAEADQVGAATPEEVVDRMSHIPV